MDELEIIYLNFPRNFDTVSHKNLLRKTNNQGEHHHFHTHTKAVAQKSNRRTVTMESCSSEGKKKKKSNCRIAKDH